MLQKRKVITASIFAVLAVTFGGLFAGEAEAAGSKWDIHTTIIGPAGEDLPLREGEQNLGTDRGFGIKHIQERHGGYVPAAGEMEIVLHNAPNCKNGLNGGDKTVECTYPVGGRDMTVAVTERIDERSGDHRPVGVITAFYR